MSDDILENLKKLSLEHEKELCDIREKIRIVDTYPKAKALVGKCFKYRNGHFFGSYTRGWVYKCIRAAVGDGVIVDSFQTDGPNKVEFSFDARDGVGSFTHNGLVKISKKTYDREFNKMMKAISRYNKRKTYGK